MKEKELENNLKNITPKDKVYQLMQRFIEDSINDPELKVLLDRIPQVSLIATDSYFLHYSVYPFLKAQNPDKIMEQARKTKLEYMASEQYQKVKSLTTLDDQLSKIYSITLLKELLKKLKEQIEENYRQQTGQQAGLQQILQQLQQQYGSGWQQQFNKMVQQALQQMTKQQKGKSSMFQQALNSAVQQAQKDTETANKVRQLIGGKEAGKEEGTFEKILDLTEQIKRTRMRDVLSFSERLMANMPRFSKIGKVKDKRGTEIAGYRVTKNINEVIARELALPEELFLKKLAGNGFLAREKQRVSEGSIYVLIDKSGSMDGEKTIWSRSVALALFKLAQQKKRRYFLRFFDTKVYPKEPISEKTEILEHIIKIRSDGGTNISRALFEAIKDITSIKELKETTNTIVIITDGEDEIMEKELKTALKENKIRLISVMIKGDNEDLKKISDEYFRTELTSEDALTLIKEAEK